MQFLFVMLIGAAILFGGVALVALLGGSAMRRHEREDYQRSTSEDGLW